MCNLRGTKVIKDYKYHVYDKWNAAHLTLQFKMLTIFLNCKENEFWKMKVMEDVVMVAWWTTVNL